MGSVNTLLYQSRRGFFIPEVNTQVIVSFINDDPRQPVILGGLYTKTTKPFTEIADNNLKAFVSKEKLTLEFDEKTKRSSLKPVIKIKSPSAKKIRG